MSTVALTPDEADSCAGYLFELAYVQLLPRRVDERAPSASTIWDRWRQYLRECGLEPRYGAAAGPLATAEQAARVDALFDVTQALADDLDRARGDLEEALAKAALLTLAPAPAVSEPAQIIPDPFLAPEPAIDEPPAELTELCKAPAGTYDGIEGGRPYCPVPCPHAVPDPEPHDAVPAALTGPRGDASGAPPVALDGGSEKPAATLTCEVCGRTFGKATSRYGHQRTHVITDKQAAILDALRAAGGVQSEAARTLALSTGSVNSAIATLRANGLLPADVEALVTKHAYRPKHELGPQTRQERGSAAERVAIHEVAERIKAREATPAQNEKTGETFEERRLRFARERVAAGRASF